MTAADIPFSFPVDVIALPANGRVYAILADEAERAAVAAQLGLAALGRLVATVTIKPMAGGTVEADGHFEADVVQTCVVTLQPLPATVGQNLVRHFAARRKPAGTAKSKTPPELDEDLPAEGWVDPNEEVPDPIVDGAIDLGALVVEELSLALDPYPRAPGVSFSGPEAGAPPVVSESPFAVLAGLKAGAPTQRRVKNPPKTRR